MCGHYSCPLLGQREGLHLVTEQQIVVNVQRGKTDLRAPCTEAVKLLSCSAAVHLSCRMIF